MCLTDLINMKIEWIENFILNLIYEKKLAKNTNDVFQKCLLIRLIRANY